MVEDQSQFIDQFLFFFNNLQRLAIGKDILVRSYSYKKAGDENERITCNPLYGFILVKI